MYNFRKKLKNSYLIQFVTGQGVSCNPNIYEKLSLKVSIVLFSQRRQMFFANKLFFGVSKYAHGEESA